jgi:tetratricopeptide (TPR) repeat protein
MMKRRHLIYQFVFLLILFLSVDNIHAQLPPAAQEAFDKGVTAAKLPDFPLAIRYFEEARKIAPEAPVIYFNLGLAESKIPGRELRAICWFAAYLATSPGAPNKAAILDQIKLLEVKNQSHFQRISEAMERGANIADKNEKDFWCDITRFWIETDELTEAVRAVEKTSACYAKNELVQALIKKGDLTQAEKVAATITGLSAESLKAQVIIASADDRIRAGETKSAQEILQNVLNFKEQINYWDYIRMSAKVAQLQAKIGDAAGVKATIEALKQISQKYSDVKFLVNVADLQANAGDINGARETLLAAHNSADKISSSSNSNDYYAFDSKSDSLKEMALQEAKIGDTDLALKTVQSITRGYYKNDTLKDIIKFQANKGDFAAALKTVEVIAEKSEKNWAWLIISQAQAENGDIDSAKKTLGLLPSDLWLQDAPIWIATAQAKAGNRSAALETLNLALADRRMLELIKDKKPLERDSEVRLITRFAEVQILAGDIPAARKTLAIAQQFCNRTVDKSIGISGSPRKNAQRLINQLWVKIGRTDSPASGWIFLLEDSNDFDDAPLSMPMFLDLGTHLKFLPQSNDPEVVFNALRDTATRMKTAQNFILELLKQQSAKL